MTKIVIVKNDSGDAVEIKNLPIRPIPDSSQVTLTNVLQLERIYQAAADTSVNSLGHAIANGVLVVNDGVNDLTPAQAETFLTDGDLGSLVGTLEQGRVTGLSNALVSKAGSPLTTTEGKFPKYVNQEGDLGDGADSVGVGGTVVTLNSHGLIDSSYLAERISKYPNLEQQGWTANIIVFANGINSYLNFINKVESANASFIFFAANVLPEKTDFTTDEDTVVIVNNHHTDLTVSINTAGDRFRVNGSSLQDGTDLRVPQFHYVQVYRGQNDPNRISVLRSGIAAFTTPTAAINILDFSIPKDVPIPTTISGTQTITFEAFNVENLDRNNLSVEITARSGGVDATQSIDASSHIIQDGINTFDFTFPILPLTQDGDFAELELEFGLINPNFNNTTSENVWRIEAREEDHPSQSTFKTGWLAGSVAIADLNSTSINNANVYDGSNNQIGSGPAIYSEILTSFDVPGVNEDGKRLLIEVQDELGEIETIVNNAGTALQSVVYDRNAPLSVDKPFNSIKYSKDVNSVSKDFTLIYSRDLLLESFEDQTLVIHTT